MRCLLKYHRCILAPAPGGLRANLYRIIRGRLETFECGGQLGRLNDGCISGVVIARVTPYYIKDIQKKKDYNPWSDGGDNLELITGAMCNGIFD